MTEKLVTAVSAMKEKEALNLVQDMPDKGEDPQEILDACNV